MTRGIRFVVAFLLLAPGGVGSGSAREAVDAEVIAEAPGGGAAHARAADGGGADTEGLDTSTVEATVLEAHRRMTAAAERLDAEGFFAFILDSARGPVIQDGRLFADRAEALEAVKRGFEGVAAVERVYETTDITVISPEAALLTGHGTSTVTLEDGRKLTGPFAVSLVFVLRDGAWKVLHGHYSTPNPR